jgi:Lipopolysaccharide-assembly
MRPFFVIYIFIFIFSSCSVKYNFTGTGKLNAKTFQVNYFLNNAPIVEPGIERTFTQKLQNVINNQTNLDLVSSNGDLLFEGEIVEYRIAPNTATADQLSAQNQMYIQVNVRYTNKNNEEDNFEKKFSHFYNYPANQLPNQVLNQALEEIYNRITQDIFNESLAKW